MKKIHFFLICLIPFHWIVITILKQNPIFVEIFYSHGLYPTIFKLHRFFFYNIPFSLGDFIYGFALIYLLKSLKDLLKGKLKVKVALWNLLSLTSLILLLFNLNWGLNYYRIPLHEKLGYELSYKEIQIENTFNKLVSATNQLHHRLCNNDSIPVKIHYSNQNITEMIEKEFDFDLNKFKPRPFIKNSIWSSLLSYMGYAGYLNPFTLESHVNNKIPKLNYIVTAAHEMAHQVGVASESEANFIAFYSSVRHTDPFIKYAGYVFALGYCYQELFKLNPKLAKNGIKTLKPGILKNFKELSEFWIRYQNPLQPFIKKGYDSYLKVNGQKKGIKSYNAMTALVVAYSENESIELDKID